MSDEPVGARRRLESLTDDGETLHGYVICDATDEGYYTLVARTWPHPDADDATTLSLRYAYLTAGDGSDGWTDAGLNMRLPRHADPDEAAHTIGQLFAGVSRNLADGDEDTPTYGLQL
jgi:hypothetical protein